MLLFKQINKNLFKPYYIIKFNTWNINHIPSINSISLNLSSKENNYFKKNLFFLFFFFLGELPVVNTKINTLQKNLNKKTLFIFLQKFYVFYLDNKLDSLALPLKIINKKLIQIPVKGIIESRELTKFFNFTGEEQVKWNYKIDLKLFFKNICSTEQNLSILWFLQLLKT